MTARVTEQPKQSRDWSMNERMNEYMIDLIKSEHMKVELVVMIA